MAAVSAIISLVWLALPSLSQGPDSAVSVTGSFGNFTGAWRCTLSPQGWILVVDREANEIVVFDSSGAKPQTFGGFGWGDLALDRPTGIATDGLNIYVSDEGNHRVQRYDRTMSLVATLNKRDTTVSRARFGYPLGVALSRHGDLFVLDGENTRVVVYSGGDFRFLRSFGDIEGGRSMLNDPLEIEVTADDNVLVLEKSRIARFDYFGNYLGSIGDGAISDARGFHATATDVFVVSADRLWSFSSTGELRWTRERSSLGPAADASLSDIAQNRGALYLLTEKTLLQLEAQPR